MKIRRLLRSRAMLALALLGDLLLFAGPDAAYRVSPGSLEAALLAQATVTDEWLGREGVVGTAVGFDGSGKAVLKVYLSQPEIAVFPRFVAGVAVQTEVTGTFRSLAEVPETHDAESADPKRGFPRPVPIGVSTGHPGVTAGTIGARVTNGLEVFALSNNHVAANNNSGKAGDNLLQPGVVDGGRDPDDAIGTLHDFEPIRFCQAGLCAANQIDAAIALTSVGNLGNETPDGGYGSPRSWTQEADLGMSVQKYGRTTGHTVGRVTGINATIDVGYRGGTARFQGQIVISGNGFSAGGDSGSLIVTKGLLLGDRRPVGLLFAGSASSTIANPIDLVLDRFKVRIDGS